jgi:hypothetical protein
MTSSKPSLPIRLLFNEADLTRRAYAAYFRAGGDINPDSGRSGVRVHNDKLYVVLANVNGVLAVYRVRNNFVLKGLRRWPKALNG